MKDQTRKWREWESTRAKGRTRFVWVNGVIGWGVFTGALFSAIMIWLNDSPVLIVPIAFVLFPIGGYFWGVLVWQLIEAQYAKALGLPAPNSSLKQIDQSLRD